MELISLTDEISIPINQESISIMEWKQEECFCKH